MSRTHRLILAVALSVAALLGAGAYAYWHFLLRGPFSGQTFHHFGDVALYEDTAPFEHTFHLANRLGRPLAIVAVRSDCGCLTARAVNRTLQPGEAFDLPVTFIAKPGERSALIHILFDDDSQALLRVKATGRLQPRLLADRTSIALSADGTAEFGVTLLTYDTSDEPAMPTVTTSNAALRAEFIGGAADQTQSGGAWALKYRPKPADMALAPTEWRGRVRVRFDTAAAGGASPNGASMTLAFAKARPLTIQVE